MPIDVAAGIEQGAAGVAGDDVGVDLDEAAQPAGATVVVVHGDRLVQRRHRSRSRREGAPVTARVADGGDLAAYVAAMAVGPDGLQLRSAEKSQDRDVVRRVGAQHLRRVRRTGRRRSSPRCRWRPSTTWWLVTTMPALSMTMPVPAATPAPKSTVVETKTRPVDCSGVASVASVASRKVVMPGAKAVAAPRPAVIGAACGGGHHGSCRQRQGKDRRRDARGHASRAVPRPGTGLVRVAGCESGERGRVCIGSLLGDVVASRWPRSLWVSCEEPSGGV